MKTYILTKPRFNHDAGTTVYAAQVHDYGLARDDSLHCGILHLSVTTQPDGGYPVFTVPVAHLKEVPA